MEFNEYQKRSRETALYPSVGYDYIYPALGLSGEAGEISEKVKKLIRDNNGKINSDFRKEIGKELGDILWYISQLASEFGLNLDEIASGNLDKISSQKRKRHASRIRR